MAYKKTSLNLPINLHTRLKRMSLELSVKKNKAIYMSDLILDCLENMIKKYESEQKKDREL